ncbi:MAG: DNRLRE domain-containing protein, partial [Anaerolineales bacterium]|nr:DNRLRE domain-containing protein [Anaerolineales bacterium]
MNFVKATGRIGYLLWGLILGLGMVASGRTLYAQPAEPETPPREQERQAPYREPAILSQATTAGGTRTVISLPAVADSYIASARPTENFGTDGLFLGYNLAGPNNYGAERILLRFDVDTFVPDGALINSAMLTLRLSFASPADDAPMGTVLRRLASGWSESGVTWANQPEWAEITGQALIGNEPAWYEWEITDLVAAWAQDTVANDGLEIIGDETVQQRERAFYARETSSDNYPRLVIDYTDIGDTMPPIITVTALPQYSRRNFDVSWSGSDQGMAGVDYYDVQVRVDGGVWQDWQLNTTDTQAEYAGAENGRLYEFRARGVDNVGNMEAYGGPEASTTADTDPPVSTVEPLPPLLNDDAFTVTWDGSDSVSGIQYFDVYWRFNGGPWQIWQQQTVATSFALANLADGNYQFEARATDNLGHVEPLTQMAEASIIIDTEAPFVTP